MKPTPNGSAALAGRIEETLGRQQLLELLQAGQQLAESDLPHLVGAQRERAPPGVEVGLGVGDGIGADDGGRARAVVDHHLLAQPRCDRLGHGARHHVGAAAGRVGHDPAQRLCGPRFGVSGCAGGEHGAGSSQGGQHEMGITTPKEGTQGAHR